MIYWNDVKEKLLEHCQAATHYWTLEAIVTHLNKEERLSMQAIADLTKGRCGRTALCLKMKELRTTRKDP